VNTEVTDDLLKSAQQKINPSNTIFHEIGHTGGLLHPDYDMNDPTYIEDEKERKLLSPWQKLTKQKSNVCPKNNATWSATNLMWSCPWSGKENISYELNSIQFKALELAIKSGRVNQESIDGKAATAIPKNK